MPIDIDEITRSLKEEQEKVASANPEDEFKNALTGEENTSTGASTKETEEKTASDAQAQKETTETTEKTANTAGTSTQFSDEDLLNKLAQDEGTQMQVAQADLVGRAMARGYYDELQQLIMPRSNYPAPQPATGGEIPQKSTQPQNGGAASAQQANPEGSEKNASVDILTRLYNHNFTN